MVDILVIFGPNLNMLGTREPEIYGSDSMADIMAALANRAEDLGRRIEMMQSNDEGELVSAIQKAREGAGAILFNLAAYTHSSVALRDALAMFDGPKVEVHLSNNDRREGFRKVSMTAGVSDGSIVGFGSDSFLLGLDAVHRLLLRRGDVGLVRQIEKGDIG
ncbi:MAG: 3-dehydroquinate dehydratase [Alphaproteobacteria bacterium]|jgi:3-dehydroquinate dehydratase-2|nr:3-dehydroquinate dehydratase [Alphaproteobacteria bacterium]